MWNTGSAFLAALLAVLLDRIPDASRGAHGHWHAVAAAAGGVLAVLAVRWIGERLRRRRGRRSRGRR